MLDPMLTTPSDDEIDHMSLRLLWDDFGKRWTPLQKALYLGQLRDQGGKMISERARALGVGEDELRRELEGLWGVLLWDRAQSDPVPTHRD